MSIRLIEQAWRTDLEPMTKLVLLALADYANSDGKCWPGLNAISTKTGASYRTVQRQIEVLESQGHLLRTVTAGKGTTYTIHPCHSDTPVTVTPGSDDVTPQSDSHEAPAMVTPPPGHSDTLTVIEPEYNRNEPSSPPTPQGVIAEEVTVSHFIETWNDLALKLKRPLAETTTIKRSAAIASLLKDYSIDQLTRAFRNASQSAWLPTFQGFTIDWMIKPDNFVKILEGHYNGAPAVRDTRDGATKACDQRIAELGGWGDTDLDDALERYGHEIIGRKSPRRNGSVSFRDALTNLTPVKVTRDV